MSCDPAFETCPVEEVFVPDFEAIIKAAIYEKSRATDLEMLSANITLLLSSIIAATFLAMYQWRYVVPNNVFNAAKKDYETKASNSYWNWA